MTTQCCSTGVQGRKMKCWKRRSDFSDTPPLLSLPCHHKEDLPLSRSLNRSLSLPAPLCLSACEVAGVESSSVSLLRLKHRWTVRLLLLHLSCSSAAPRRFTMDVGTNGAARLRITVHLALLLSSWWCCGTSGEGERRRSAALHPLATSSFYF